MQRILILTKSLDISRYIPSERVNVSHLLFLLKLIDLTIQFYDLIHAYMSTEFFIFNLKNKNSSLEI